MLFISPVTTAATELLVLLVVASVSFDLKRGMFLVLV